MIDCRKCEFSIKGSMRHALVNNCCPSCGSAILGETHVQRMRLFKQRLLQQHFSQEMSEDLVFDITLFMLLEFSPISAPSSSEEGIDAEVDVNPEDSPSSPSDEEGDYEKIREQIREEVLSGETGSSEDLDEELKIARLKRVAKNSKVKMAGASVRRLGGD